MSCERNPSDPVNEYCAFAPELPMVNFSLTICETAFGVTSDQVYEAVHTANQRYGGAAGFNGTRVSSSTLSALLTVDCLID
jgi:hypothetical protein